MAPNRPLLHRIFHGSVGNRYRYAGELYENLRAIFMSDEIFARKLEVLRDHAEQLNGHMAKMHLGRLCAACSAGAGGGCCSLYMAGEPDAVQMLMNLLAGIEVEFVRDDGRECCFLGEQGCIFLFKPMFCLNYNCARIHDTASTEDLAKLERLTGRLLGQQYEVEKDIIDILTAQIKS